jgi:hypothetical protein
MFLQVKCLGGLGAHSAQPPHPRRDLVERLFQNRDRSSIRGRRCLTCRSMARCWRHYTARCLRGLPDMPIPAMATRRAIIPVPPLVSGITSAGALSTFLSRQSCRKSGTADWAFPENYGESSQRQLMRHDAEGFFTGITARGSQHGDHSYFLGGTFSVKPKMPCGAAVIFAEEAPWRLS